MVPPPGAGPVCQGAPGRAPDSGVGAVGALGAAGAGIPLGSLGLEAAGAPAAGGAACPIGGAAGGAP